MPRSDRNWAAATGVILKGDSNRYSTILSVALRYLVMAALGLGLSTFHEPPPVQSLLDPWLIGGVVAGLELPRWGVLGCLLLGVLAAAPHGVHEDGPARDPERAVGDDVRRRLRQNRRLGLGGEGVRHPRGRS